MGEVYTNHFVEMWTNTSSVFGYICTDFADPLDVIYFHVQIKADFPPPSGAFEMESGVWKTTAKISTVGSGTILTSYYELVPGRVRPCAQEHHTCDDKYNRIEYTKEACQKHIG